MHECDIGEERDLFCHLEQQQQQQHQQQQRKILYHRKNGSRYHQSSLFQRSNVNNIPAFFCQEKINEDFIINQ